MHVLHRRIYTHIRKNVLWNSKFLTKQSGPGKVCEYVTLRYCTLRQIYDMWRKWFLFTAGYDEDDFAVVFPPVDSVGFDSSM